MYTYQVKFTQIGEKKNKKPQKSQYAEDDNYPFHKKIGYR